VSRAAATSASGLPRPLLETRGHWGAARSALALLLYLAFAFVLPLLMTARDSDLDVFFWPAAELAVHGHPLAVYTIQAGPYPNANGPLSLIPLTAVAFLANALGWASQPALRDGLALAAFSIFTLLAAHEADALIEMAGVSGRRPTVYAATCLSIPLWLATGSFGHIEIPLELWLTMLALRLVLLRRTVAPGILAGLVLLTRSAALVAVLCLAILALSGDSTGSLWRRLGRSATLAATALGAALLGLLPFLIATPRSVFSSLLTSRASLPISGGSAWVLLARGLPWARVVQGGDAELFTIACLLLVGVASWRVRRSPIDVRIAAGLMTLALCCVPLLAKTVWAYYLAEPTAFAIIWALARSDGRSWGRWTPPILLGAVSLALASSGLVTPPTTAQVVVGVAATGVVGACMVMILRDVIRLRRPEGQRAELRWANLGQG
jgi:hypothetical protein